MLLKLLFIAVVLYYAVKTFRALMRAISQDGTPSRLRDERREPGLRQNGASADRHEDVEDAKFVDI